MNRHTLFSMLVLLAGSCGQSLYAQFKIPAGFSELKKSPSNGLPMKRICIDFDGDGKKDTATVIEQNDSELQFCFLIYLTGSNKNNIIEMFGNGSPVFPVQLSVKNKTIQFAYFLAGTGTHCRALKLRYHPANHKIQLVGYDFGYRLYHAMGGRCEKSYNLLTGDYMVTNRFYDFEDLEHNEIHKGNEKIKAIFAEDINDTLLEQLDLVGSDFL